MQHFIYSRLEDLRKPGGLGFAILLALSSAGIAYLLLNVFWLRADSPSNGLDFRVIWLAGKLWSAGVDAYGPQFVAQYGDYFGGRPSWHFWAYPPYWFPICTLLSKLDFQTGVTVWKLANLGMMLAGLHFTARALTPATGRTYWIILLSGMAYMTMMQATATTVFLGQTVVLIFFGFSLVIFGLLKERHWATIIGLVIIALKPHIAIAAFAWVFLVPRRRGDVLAAGAVCCAVWLFVYYSFGIEGAFSTFVSALAQYSNMPEVGPDEVTGLFHLTDFVLGYSGNRLVFVGLALLLAGAIVLLDNIRAPVRPDGNSMSPTSLLAVLGTMFFVLPLQVYDHVLLAILVMCVVASPRWGNVLIVLGLAVAFRVGNLASLIGIRNPESVAWPQSLLMSIALLLIFLGAMQSFYRIVVSPEGQSKATSGN